MEAGHFIPDNGGDRRGISAARLKSAALSLPRGLAPTVLSLLRRREKASFSQPFVVRSIARRRALVKSLFRKEALNGAALRADAAERGGPLRLRSLTKDKKEELEALGMEAILTRSDERALAEGKKADMAARGKIMNGEGVDLVVSVHMNKFTDPSVHGPMAFYMKGSAEGERLAKTVIDSITDELGAPRRIANPGDYYVIRESICLLYTSPSPRD